MAVGYVKNTYLRPLVQITIAFWRSGFTPSRKKDSVQVPFWDKLKIGENRPDSTAFPSRTLMKTLENLAKTLKI